VCLVIEKVVLLKIFITGMPGVGKTTVVHKVIAILKEKGLRVGGIYCPEIRVDNVRVGFEVVDLLTGTRGILSRVDRDSGPRVGKYRVNVQHLSSIGVKGLNSAIREADYIVIDEIGPMELQGEDFQEAVRNVVEGTKPVLGITHWKMNHRLIDWIRARSDVRIIEVTLENRETIHRTIAGEILEAIRS
jgi:nucleoside-triphosphatase